MSGPELPELVAPVGGELLAPAEAELVAELVAAGVSPRTVRAYRAAWAAWAAWASARGVEPLPAPPELLALYLAQLAQAGRRPSTIALALAGLGAVHRAQGHPSPRAHPAISAVVRGIARAQGVRPEGRAALGLAELLAGLPRGDGPKARRDRALLLLGWSGAFRRSELVGLDAGDVRELPEGLAVRLRRSKADQLGAGALVGVPRGSAPGRCPVLALAAWRELLGEGPGPLFRPVNRHGGIGAGRLGADALGPIVKAAAERAGLDPASFGAHSLRAGFVTEAARAGVPEHRIARHTRHRSIAVLRGYVREGSIWRDNAAAALL